MIFFNAALVACAIIRFRGGDPTVMDGLRAATARAVTATDANADIMQAAQTDRGERERTRHACRM